MLSIKEKLAQLQGERSAPAHQAVQPSSDPQGMAELELHAETTPTGSVWRRQRHISQALAPMVDLAACSRLAGMDLALIAKSWDFRDLAAKDLIFIDTETTGLAGGSGTYAFLVGLARLHQDGLAIRQYFLLNQGQERSMLQAIGEEMGSAKALISFNGKSYDVPLLRSRFILNRLPFAWEASPHLDLLHAARRIWKGMDGYALTNLEREVLRFQREGDVPGYQIPELYFTAVRSGQFAPLKGIFQHNVMDLLSLAGLLVHAQRRFQLREEPQSRDITGIVRTLIELGLDEMAEGFCQSHLTLRPDAPWPLVMRQHARILKRQRKYGDMVRLWEKWIGNMATFNLEPYEELAKYFEHIAHDYGRALQIIERAWQRLEISSQMGSRTLATTALYANLQKRRLRVSKKLKKLRDHEGSAYDG